MDQVLGGWQVAGFLRYQTGRPFTIFSGANTLSSVFQSTVQCNGCSPDEGHVFTNSAGIIQYFDQATRDKFTLTPAGEIGNTGRNFFNLAPTIQHGRVRVEAVLLPREDELRGSGGRDESDEYSGLGCADRGAYVGNAWKSDRTVRDDGFS